MFNTLTLRIGLDRGGAPFAWRGTHARSSTVNSPSYIVQRSPLKQTEHGGGPVQGGTKALGYKVTWLRMNTPSMCKL